MKNWKKYLEINEMARFKGFERQLKNQIFPHVPEFVFNDMYGHEGLKDFAVDRGEDINKVGMEEFFATDEFARSWVDRYDLEWTQKPVILDLAWEDLGKKERSFLMGKHHGLNPNFPQDKYQEKIQRIIDTIPGLGEGDHEPVILQMDGDKVIDILGGRHRTFAAFLKNNFEPIKIKAYVGI